MFKILNIVLNDFTNDSRVLKTSLTLSKMNFFVEVLALHKNNLIEEESYKNIFNIKRIKFPNLFKKNGILKFMFFCFFVLKQKDIYAIHCNDLAALYFGVIYKIFNWKTKIIYDSHEYQSEILGFNKFKRFYTKKIEAFLLLFVDEVITVSDGIANEYQRLFNIKKPYVLINSPNSFSLPKKNNYFREEFNIKKESKVFLYQGSISKGRGIETILEAFSKLNQKYGDQYTVVFMGYGVLVEKVKEYSRNNSNIFYQVAVAPDIVLNYTMSADFGLCMTQPNCLNHIYCLPNKFFEYMAANIPVISADLKEVKKLVDEYNLGVVMHEYTTDGLIAAVLRSFEFDEANFNKNIVKFNADFSWESQAERILSKVYKNE